MFEKCNSYPSILADFVTMTAVDYVESQKKNRKTTTYTHMRVEFDVFIIYCAGLSNEEVNCQRMYEIIWNITNLMSWSQFFTCLYFEHLICVSVCKSVYGFFLSLLCFPIFLLTQTKTLHMIRLANEFHNCDEKTKPIQ